MIIALTVAKDMQSEGGKKLKDKQTCRIESKYGFPKVRNIKKLSSYLSKKLKKYFIAFHFEDRIFYFFIFFLECRVLTLVPSGFHADSFYKKLHQIKVTRRGHR